MSTQLLTVLQLCVLALIYLFFVRVLRSVWTEIHVSNQSSAPSLESAPPPQPIARAVPQAAPQMSVPTAPSQLVVLEPAAQQGLTYGLGGEVTLGRSSACTVRIDDTYVSSMHARIASGPGGLVIDDLGSTNGTYVNSGRVQGSVALGRGDLVQIGSTLLEVR